MSGSLSGKTAFVTGGSRGIGRAIVRTLVGQGARVAFTYRSQRDEALSLQREFPDVVRAFEMEGSFSSCFLTFLDLVRRILLQLGYVYTHHS